MLAPPIRLISRRCCPSISTLASRAAPRLDLISRHLDRRPFLELNTPYSTERSSSPDSDVGGSPLREQKETPAKPDENPIRMSSQQPHAAVMIPGPVEFDDAVLNAMSHYRYASHPPPHAHHSPRLTPPANRTSAPPSSRPSARRSPCCASSSRPAIRPRSPLSSPAPAPWAGTRWPRTWPSLATTSSCCTRATSPTRSPTASRRTAPRRRS